MTTFYNWIKVGTLNWMTIFCQIDFEKKKLRFCLEKIVISIKKSHMIQKATTSDFDKWWPQSVTIKSDFTRAARALCNESQNEILAFPRTMPFQGGLYLLWLLKLKNVSPITWLKLKKGCEWVIFKNKKLWQTFFQGQFESCLRVNSRH